MSRHRPRNTANAGLSLLLGVTFATASCSENRDATAGDRDSPDAPHNLATLIPELTLGDVGTAPEYSFASIQSILVLWDGTIWVVDGESTAGQTPLLRRYDSQGNYLGQVGREGQGPGEYRDPDGLALMADGRVALRDLGLPGRITLYSVDGQVDTTWSLGRTLRWRPGAGHSVQVDTSGVMWLPFIEGRPGPNRPPPRYLRVRPDGTIVDRLPFPSIRVPEVDRVSLTVTRTTPSGGTDRRRFSLPYQPSGRWAWSPYGEFAAAGTDRYRIELLRPRAVRHLNSDAPGDTIAGPARVIEMHVTPTLVPNREREAARQRLVERVSAFGGASGTRIPDMPTHKPPIKGMRFADDGRLWVSVSMPSRLHDSAWIESTAFDVFDRDGSFRGRVVLPDFPSIGDQIFRMRGDHLWAVFRDEFGVESIRRYEIAWP